jgi:hypothetical protein
LAARDLPRLHSATDLVHLLPWLDARLCRDAIVATRVRPFQELEDGLGVAHR